MTQVEHAIIRPEPSPTATEKPRRLALVRIKKNYFQAVKCKEKNFLKKNGGGLLFLGQTNLESKRQSRPER